MRLWKRKERLNLNDSWKRFLVGKPGGITLNWFTSDTHFGHKGVIEYCKRPFSSVEEMDAEMIRRWNLLVKDGDHIFHLGDFSFCGAIRTAEILSSLKGRKVLVQGNHDHWKPEKYIRLGFQEVKPWIQFNDFLLSHYPYKGEELDDRKFGGQFEDNGGWLLHGHVHCGWKTKKKMINVGVDQWDFAPVSEEEITLLCRNKEK